MELTHLDERGRARMVDVSEKDSTARTALAKGCIKVSRTVMTAILDDAVPKGDVLSVARIAGIMAVKQTANLIPMCHPLPVNGCVLEFEINEESLLIEAACQVKVDGKTGVEMEALTGVSVALLTIYDMCKALDKSMEIGEIRLEKKAGGKSGVYERGEDSGKGTGSMHK